MLIFCLQKILGLLLSLRRKPQGKARIFLCLIIIDKTNIFPADIYIFNYIKSFHRKTEFQNFLSQLQSPFSTLSFFDHAVKGILFYFFFCLERPPSIKTCLYLDFFKKVFAEAIKEPGKRVCQRLCHPCEACGEQCFSGHVGMVKKCKVNWGHP